MNNTVIEKTAPLLVSNDARDQEEFSLSPKSTNVLMMNNTSLTGRLASAPLAARKSLLLKWIPLLYRGGATSFVAQRHVDVLSKILDLSLNTTYIPGRMLINWQDNANDDSSIKNTNPNEILPEPTLIIMTRWGFNMVLWERMENLLATLEGKREGIALEIADVHALLDEIARTPPSYNNWIVVLAFGVLSGTMAPAFFGGYWLDGIMALILGALAGWMVVLCDFFPLSFNPFHELLSSYIVSLLTIILVHIQPDLNYWPIVLASTIWILPGFSMVIGATDVVLKFPLTGFIIHFNAVFIGLTMALGYAFSAWTLKAINAFTSFPVLNLMAPAENQLHTSVMFLCCAIFAIACAIIFQSSPRQFPLVAISVVLCMALCTYMTTAATGLLISDEIQAFLIAMIIAIFIRCVAAVLRQVPEASLYVAVLPLVPGSRIVKSFFSLLFPIHDVFCDPKGFKPVYNSIFICISVAFGLVLGQNFFNHVIQPFIVPYTITPLTRYLRKRFKNTQGPK